MKIFKLITIGMILFLSSALKAQVSVNVNIGSPPMWGPVGYSEERYYYLPDVEAYYDVQSSMFIYFGDGVWLHRTYLPQRYRNYDLYNGYKVVITGYRGNAPYHNFKNHKMKYAKGFRGGNQQTIGKKPGNGNSGGRVSQNKQGSHSNGKRVESGNGRSSGHGNNQKSQQGHGGNIGKKK